MENPERSIELADRAVADLLEERNVIADSAQSEAVTERDIAVTHPDVADGYREARRIRADVVSGTVSSSATPSASTVPCTSVCCRAES